MLHSRLSTYQQMDKEKLKCVPSDPANYQQTQWMHTIH
jgi:hypothetical protein